MTRLVGEGLSPAEAADFTARLGYEVVPADSGTAVTISTFQHKTRRRGVSLGDQFCLALGIERRVPVLTGEKRWPQLGLDVEIILIR
ncbi:MAG TPA: hypothetical protein VFE03_02085 [Caulobacteraceae bacterium]|nr:hypothetical protein [Caulobacteraceae bacterium]